MMRISLVLPASDEKRSSAIPQVTILNLQVDSYLSYWKLDSLPEPARDTLEEMIARGFHVTDARIITSRGCPFKRTFCVDPSLGYRVKWRARSADRLTAEFRESITALRGATLAARSEFC